MQATEFRKKENMTKKEDMSKNKLYIENLPHDFTNDQLNDLFK